MKYRYRSEGEMKDSGVELIPATWKLSKLKYLLSNIQTGSTPDTRIQEYFDGDIDWFTPGDFIEDLNLIVAKRKVSEIAIKNKEVRILPQNTILVVGIGATLGKVGFVENESTFNQQITGLVVIENIIYPKFLAYYLHSNKLAIIQQANYTTLPIINNQQLKEIPIKLPCAKEQEKIVKFLDEKTAQFDFIISKKEDLIQRLQEAKKSLISEVVTGKVKVVKTSDGYKLVERKKEEMKDSGVEWLGDVPKVWDVKRLKHVLFQPLKYGANESAELYDRTLPRYIRITDFGDNGQLKDETFKSLSLDKARDYYLEEGDILFARSGATVGKTLLFKNYKGKACFAGYLIKATLNKEIVKPEFLYSFTKSKGYENWKNSIFMQATIQNIGADKYKELKFAVPNKIEQELICEYIYNKEHKHNILISKIKQQIEKLKQAKQSLISEAVTGKIEILD